MKSINNIRKVHSIMRIGFIGMIMLILSSISTWVNAQKTQICGTVFDASCGDALPGVNVVVKGTTNGAVTDLDGNYCIWTDKTDDILVFSFIGYLTEEVQIGGQNHVNIALVENFTSLDEVVVVGYGSRVVSNVSSIFRTKKSNPKSKISSAVNQNNTTSWNNPYADINNKEYSEISENGFHQANLDPLSTFSLDVDAASYSNLRRYLNNGQLPPKDAVRIEEMINYFNYEYPEPEGEDPVSIITELANCPWNSTHKLLHIGIKGREISKENLPPNNLVFLLDVSGSMDSYNKLPLVKSSLKLLVNELRKEDRVAIVVYAGAAGLVLKSTPGEHKDVIINAINSMHAGGSTAGGEGIQLAYETAERNFIRNGNNRIILATDGDFNVGIASLHDLEKFIEQKRKTGIYLTCLGFGMGNYKDSKIEMLADKGNGNYAYIDNIQEANKVLVEEFSGTLYTIAKDTKIQVEFNPANVSGYRLIGYENRLLQDEDFKDDTKDAGEIGAGNTVTALYEIIPTGVESKYLKEIDPLKYSAGKESNETYLQELLTIKFRYKNPDENTSAEMIHSVLDQSTESDKTSENFRFSAAVALFGMLLRNSEMIENGDYQTVLNLASSSRGDDPDGYRAEFIRLVKAVSLNNNISMTK